MRKLFYIVVLAASFNTLNAQEKQYVDLIQPSIFALTRVMMHDVVNPPAASRFYSYCLLGACESMSVSDSSIPGILKLVEGYLPSSKNIYTRTSDPQITALFSILETGKQMLPSGYMIQGDQDDLVLKLRKRKVPMKVISESMDAAVQIAKDIIRYAATDNYNKLSTRLRYTPKKGEGYWYPTPPSYLEAVEPNWRTIRPFLIDSCNQFAPAKPVAYSNDTTSEFFRLANEVYLVGNKLTPAQLHIAAFWDCNPFAIENSGHLALGFKKISPGGHWMNIAAIAASKARLTFGQTILLESAVAISLMDAFISCWDEKYRSHRIRPETFINKKISVKWQPLLQTPPFPEYPSGHSVISTAAAEVLTYYLGDNFSYTDDTEVMFEIPARTFTSFRAAAAEAAISRLYGGIHFRDAIVNGQEEGGRVGRYIVDKLKRANSKPFTR